MKKNEFRAWVYTAGQLDEAICSSDVSMVYTPEKLLSEKYAVFADRIIVLPPEFLGGIEEQTKNRLEALKEMGFIKALAHTAGHIELLKSIGLNVYGGARLNCTNSESMSFFADNGLCDIIVSQELTAKQINRLRKPISTGIIAYGKIPLMLDRRCPVKDGRPCGGANAGCDRKITDRKGNTLEILCSDNSVEILNSDTLILSDKLSDFDIDFAVLRFTTEKEISSVISCYRDGIMTDTGRYTRGLYYRGVS